MVPFSPGIFEGRKIFEMFGLLHMQYMNKGSAEEIVRKTSCDLDILIKHSPPLKNKINMNI